MCDDRMGVFFFRVGFGGSSFGHRVHNFSSQNNCSQFGFVFLVYDFGSHCYFTILLDYFTS